MSEGPSAAEQREHTLHAMRSANITLQKLWLHYYSIGGDADEFDLDAYLHGAADLSRFDRKIVSYAVNELIAQAPPPSTAHSDGS